MPSKRRNGSILPRRGARPVPDVLPSAHHVSRRGFLIVSGIAALSATGLVTAGILARGDDGHRPSVAAPTDATADRGKGRIDAPVTIVEYADMQCPVCAEFAKQIEPRIVAEYVDRSIVRLEYRHFAFLGNESQRAAQACECAGEQGRFVTYRDALFNAQHGENRGGFRDSRLIAIAEGIGLDKAAFSAALDSGRNADRVKNETLQGQLQGVKATPTFIINGRTLEGLAPYASFKQLIDQAAASGPQP